MVPQLLLSCWKGVGVWGFSQAEDSSAHRRTKELKNRPGFSGNQITRPITNEISKPFRGGGGGRIRKWGERSSKRGFGDNSLHLNVDLV